MGTRTTGTLIYKATHGSEGKVVIDGVTSIEQLQAIRNKINSYVDATCVSTSFTTTEGSSVDSLGTGNTDRRGILRYRDNTAVRTKSISIPGLKTGETVVVMEGEGERVLDTVVKGIIEVIGGATGKDVTPLGGYVVQGK